MCRSGLAVALYTYIRVYIYMLTVSYYHIIICTRSPMLNIVIINNVYTLSDLYRAGLASSLLSVDRGNNSWYHLTIAVFDIFGI